MRKTLLIVFTFVCTATYAHEDIRISINKGNVHFEYLMGWEQFEINHKIDILLELSTKLLISKGYNATPFYIYFRHDYTKRDTSYYALGFGEFSYWDYEKTKSKDIVTTGLKLIIRDRGFDIKEMLNLINSALMNINIIKANQKQLIIDLHSNDNGVLQYDTLYTISSDLVKKFLNSKDTTIERLMNEKIYRNYKPIRSGVDTIDYYFQNDKFHFYDTRDEEWVAGDYVKNQNYGKNILDVNNILEIFGSDNDGHFVFIDDSTFYYLPLNGDKFRGPFKVDSVRAGRPPTRKYYHENQPINRFTLFFDNYRFYNKALFFPDSNLVISNFDKIEDDLINKLIGKEDIKWEEHTSNTRPKKEDDKNNVAHFILLTILAVSIVLNLYLLSRKRK
ncbi:MAG: hypothetical protein ABI723_07890 [Bacteroidia bacterium]